MPFGIAIDPEILAKLTEDSLFVSLHSAPPVYASDHECSWPGYERAPMAARVVFAVTGGIVDIYQVVYVGIGNKATGPGMLVRVYSVRQRIHAVMVAGCALIVEFG